MSTATSGRAREHRVRDHLVTRGWVPIMRAAASKGAADLLMAHAIHGPALIQVGTAASKRLGPADRERLVNAAELCSALPLLAACAPGVRPRFYLVTRDIPSRWDEYLP